MSLLRFLGLERSGPGREAEPDSLLEVAARLEDMPPEDARLAAAFAYLLARVAGADLRTEAEEVQSMAARLVEFAGLDTAHADMVVEAAIGAATLHGATDDHLVTRAFRDMTGNEERLRLLRCLYAVAAADETISTREDNEIFQIAEAIGMGRPDVIALRSEWRDFLGAMKALPQER